MLGFAGLKVSIAMTQLIVVRKQLQTIYKCRSRAVPIKLYLRMLKFVLHVIFTGQKILLKRREIPFLALRLCKKQAGADLADPALGPTLMGGGTDLFRRPLLCVLRLSWHTNCAQHLLGD